MRRPAYLALACSGAASLFLLLSTAGCNDRACARAGVLLDKVDARLSQEGSGFAFQACGPRSCADLLGNIYEPWNLDTPLVTLGSEATRVRTANWDTDEEVYCGDGGRAVAASIEDLTTWQPLATGTSSDFTYAGNSPTGGVCVALDGHLDLGDAGGWVPHEPFPASPVDRWELASAYLWELDDGSLWVSGSNEYELDHLLLEPGERVVSVTRGSTPDKALWAVTDRGVLLRVSGTGQVTRHSPSASVVDPAEEPVAIEPWVAGQGHRSWVVDSEGCAWLGEDFDSLEMQTCFDRTSFELRRVSFGAGVAEVYHYNGADELVSTTKTIRDSLILFDVSEATVSYEAEYQRCGAYRPAQAEP